MKTNQLKRVFILAGLVLMGTQLFARDLFEIRGKIVKSETQEADYASVVLLDSKSMEIIVDTTCNVNGEFLIDGVEKGNYILLVQKAGYQKPEKRIINITEKGVVIELVE
jgi:hypothetical protein